MIYGYNVKYKGVFYAAGENVPDDNTPVYASTEEEDKELFVTAPSFAYEQLAEMTIKEITALAAENGLTIQSTKKQDVINEFLNFMEGR